VAQLAGTEQCAPAVRLRVEPVGDDVELDPLTLEDRIDELAEAAREDEWPALSGELGEPGSHADVRSNPGNDLVEGSPDGLELERDDLVQREVAAETSLGLLVDADVAELQQDEVEAVDLGHGSVPVHDEAGRHGRLISAPARRAAPPSTMRGHVSEDDRRARPRLRGRGRRRRRALDGIR